MKLKIPPAVQVLFFALLMWLQKRFIGGTHFEFTYQKEISWGIFLIGIFIGLSAVYSFKKAKTSTNPLNPEKASSLVVKGLYNYTRNPMYVAMLFVLLAFFLRLGNVVNLVIIALYVWYITEFQIKPEEKALTTIFGNDYVQYKSRVRRWI